VAASVWRTDDATPFLEVEYELPLFRYGHPALELVRNLPGLEPWLQEPVRAVYHRFRYLLLDELRDHALELLGSLTLIGP
jgi:hypothetical protein